MRLLLALLGALAGGARAEMLHLNCSGLGFEAALQATVAQGLLNREAPRVWLSDVAEGLGDAGQQDGAGFPGAKFIEWKTGHGGGPWYQPATTCRTCGGLRERWLETAAAAAGETPRPITFAALMKLAEPLLSGRSLYRMSELHALGPLLTMAGTDGVLPTTADHSPLPSLPLALNASGRWADATAATRWTTAHLLAKTNTSVLAVQAPTCLPFLADAIVEYRMASFCAPSRYCWRLGCILARVPAMSFWTGMDNMCDSSTAAGRAQHEAMEALLEGGHYDNTQGLYYMGWYNHTREPNPELLEECTALHRL
eukprot:COSAG04_NODE_6107_length_1409_cov_1.776336_2_plen_312_part_00